MTADHDRSFFRVPCELQIRFRLIDEEEFKVFKSFSLRPSTYSALRTEIETQIRGLSIREESKNLFERGFQLLINLDQRLERLEELMQQLVQGGKEMVASYDWVHGDLGAGGLAFKSEKISSLKKNQKVVADLILPSLPEYRLVAAAEVAHIEVDGRIGLEFLAIHDDDREFIHRFVISREREILRSSAQVRDESPSPKK